MPKLCLSFFLFSATFLPQLLHDYKTVILGYFSKMLGFGLSHWQIAKNMFGEL